MGKKNIPLMDAQVVAVCTSPVTESVLASAAMTGCLWNGGSFQTVFWVFLEVKTSPCPYWVTSLSDYTWSSHLLCLGLWPCLCSSYVSRSSLFLSVLVLSLVKVQHRDGATVDARAPLTTSDVCAPWQYLGAGHLGEVTICPFLSSPSWWTVRSVSRASSALWLDWTHWTDWPPKGPHQTPGSFLSCRWCRRSRGWDRVCRESPLMKQVGK